MSTAMAEGTRWDLTKKVFFVSSRGGVVFCGLLICAVAISRLVYPFDVGQYEAFSWVPTAHLIQGVNPYSKALTPPYSMAPYGIVYYALLGVGQIFFGLQMWFGRSLSILACVACIWASARISKALTGSREGVWVTRLLSITLFPVQAWVGVMRSDMISIAFGLTAVSLVLSSDAFQSKRIVWATGIAVLCVAAVFTKQTTWLPAGIIVLRLLQIDRGKDAAIFIITYLFLAGLIVLLLNSTSNGGYVWQHFTHAQKLPYSFWGAWEEILTLLETPTIIVLFTASIVFAYYYHKTGRTSKLPAIRSARILVLFYLFLSLISGIVSCGRVGSNVNYFLEASFVLAIVGGLIWNELRRSKVRQLSTALIVLVTLGGTFQLLRVARGEYFRWRSLNYYREISDTASEYIKPGSVCVSTYAEIVMRRGCQLHFDDIGEYAIGWSEDLSAAFNEQVAKGRYDVIVWNTDTFADEFPNYQQIAMSQTSPDRYRPVYLYVRKSIADGSK